MPKISNTAHRNVSLMLAVAFFCGFIYCVYDAISNDGSWLGPAVVLIVTLDFAKSYLVYRKAVKRGNLYGRVMSGLGFLTYW